MTLTSTGRHRRSWMDAPTQLLRIPTPVVYGAHAVGARPEGVERPVTQFINAGPYVGAGRHALRSETA